MNSAGVGVCGSADANSLTLGSGTMLSYRLGLVMPVEGVRASSVGGGSTFKPLHSRQKLKRCRPASRRRRLRQRRRKFINVRLRHNASVSVRVSRVSRRG